MRFAVGLFCFSVVSRFCLGEKIIMLFLFVLFVFCLVLFCLSIVYFVLPYLLSLSSPSFKTVQSTLSLYKEMSSFCAFFPFGVCNAVYAGSKHTSMLGGVLLKIRKEYKINPLGKSTK